MSATPYADVGFCLECATQHARDVEHHLDDAVKFSKGDPTRERFRELLDRQRIIRKDVDKLRLQQIQETGGETCIACEIPVEETPRRKTEEERMKTHKAKYGTEELPPRGTGLGINPQIPEICEFAKEEVKPKEYFDPRSFRTLCPESPTRLCKDLPPEMACATRIIIGCPEGEFVEERCRVGTEAHVIYHTKGVKG